MTGTTARSQDCINNNDNGGIIIMKNLNMKSAIKRYNGIMQCIGYDHLTIGTNLSEGTENWNIRDIVAECSYLQKT